MRQITPCLWFEHQAEEAARFYTSLFPNSRIRRTVRFGDTGPGPKGAVMTVEFDLSGQRFIALNGGPEFPFTEAVSLVVHCRTQAELDRYWNRLAKGGTKVRCGWLKDRYGLSWQVVPAELPRWMASRDSIRAQRVMEAILGMVKLDIARLRAAWQGSARARAPRPASRRSRP